MNLFVSFMPLLLLVFFCSANFAAATPDVPSWHEAFDSLAGAFRDSSAERSALVALMFQVSARDLNYADVFCSHLDFVECLGGSAFTGLALSKGSAHMAAWPLRIIIRDRRARGIDFGDGQGAGGDGEGASAATGGNNNKSSGAHANDGRRKPVHERVHYGRLPRNTLAVRFECGASFSAAAQQHEGGNGGEEHEFDLFQSVIARGGSQIREIEIDDCHLVSKSTTSEANDKQEVSTPALDLTALKIMNSLIGSSFTSPFMSDVLSLIRRLEIVDSTMAMGANLPQLLRPMAKLDTLRIRSLDEHQITSQQQQQQQLRPLQLLPIIKVVAMLESATNIRDLDLETLVEVGNGTKKQAPFSQEEQEQLFEYLKRFDHVEHLRLANLPITEIRHDSISSAVCKSLSVVGAHLTELPSSLHSFTSLEELDFSGNEITALPANFAEAASSSSSASPSPFLPRSVRRVKLSNNKISTGFDTAKQMPSHLVELDLSHNLMVGNVDFTKLSKHRSISMLDLSHNRFSGEVNLRELPDSIRKLFINDNKFSGRYDLTKVPLLSEVIAIANNDWTSLMPRRVGSKVSKKKKAKKDD